MKTKTRILGTGLAAAILGTVFLAAPPARADHDKALIAAGALIGGLLGYIASEIDDDHCPVVVHRPVVVAPRAVTVVHWPVVVAPRPVVVAQPHRPQPPRQVAKHSNKPDHRHGHKPYANNGGHQAHGRR